MPKNWKKHNAALIELYNLSYNRFVEMKSTLESLKDKATENYEFLKTNVEATVKRIDEKVQTITHQSQNMDQDLKQNTRDYAELCWKTKFTFESIDKERKQQTAAAAQVGSGNLGAGGAEAADQWQSTGGKKINYLQMKNLIPKG